MRSLLVSRPLAYFIDFLIMWCAVVLPQMLAYWLFNGFPFERFDQPLEIYFWVLGTVSLPIWLYFIIREKSAARATIGKRVMKLIVTDYKQERISGKKAFLRTFFKLLPWELTHIGLIPIYFSEDPKISTGLWLANSLILVYIIYFIAKKGRTSIHDQVAKTQVLSGRVV